MNMNTAKVYTEPIFTLLDTCRARLAEHPLLVAAQDGDLSTEVLHRFALYQYSDSILWIPMLAQMKTCALRSARLRRAIEDNIAHEAGIGGVSHVTLAIAMMRSLDLCALDAFSADTFAASAARFLSDEFAAFEEPDVAGWLLVAETLVPQLFAAVEPSFARLGADTTYFREHIAVDADEHATWMAEAVEDVVALYGPRVIAQILAGMLEAFDETMSVPDALWSGR